MMNTVDTFKVGVCATLFPIIVDVVLDKIQAVVWGWTLWWDWLRDKTLLTVGLASAAPAETNDKDKDTEVSWWSNLVFDGWRRLSYLSWSLWSVGWDGVLFSSSLRRSCDRSSEQQLWLKQKAEQPAAVPAASAGNRPPEPSVSCTDAPRA